MPINEIILSGGFVLLAILWLIAYRKQDSLHHLLLRNDEQLSQLYQQVESSTKNVLEIWHTQKQMLHQQQALEQHFHQNREQQLQQNNLLQHSLLTQLGQFNLSLEKELSSLKEILQIQHAQFQQNFAKDQIEHFKSLQDSLQKSAADIREQVTTALRHNAQSIEQRMDKLTENTQHQLQAISGQVEKRLTEGFEKTTATFNDVVKRLAMIDAAQQKITELSSNVVSLQEVLSDKRSRGAFGEVQLLSLVRNMLPEASFAVQATLSNGKRADCLLYLPEPTGNVAIDAKFPLENYRLMTKAGISDADKKAAEQQFRVDIRKHIDDISGKYIIPGETSDGAVMFIPAEAIFAEIHAHYPDLVEFSQRARVWMVSPTTFMAILTTARAVLKDAATRKQVHIIQEHLHYLAKDFNRFEKRMESLARHIDQAHSDVQDVNTSAKKISNRFGQIEKVDLQEKIAASETLLEDTTT